MINIKEAETASQNEAKKTKEIKIFGIPIYSITSTTTSPEIIKNLYNKPIKPKNKIGFKQ